MEDLFGLVTALIKALSERRERGGATAGPPPKGGAERPASPGSKSPFGSAPDGSARRVRSTTSILGAQQGGNAAQRPGLFGTQWAEFLAAATPAAAPRAGSGTEIGSPAPDARRAAQAAPGAPSPPPPAAAAAAFGRTAGDIAGARDTSRARGPLPAATPEGSLVRAMFASPQSVAAAFIAAEIFARPVALRDP